MGMKIIECPRDAMQGIKEHIPTPLKAAYLNALLGVGFDTLDFGSFVSPRAIPQMADTREVLSMLDLSETKSKLLAIVANVRGARDACQFPEIRYLGYPFSISETFQLRNTRKTIAQSLEIVKEIQDMCVSHDKELVVYLSMAFGNPYADEWSAEIVEKWAEVMAELGVGVLSLADTVGTADASSIEYLFSRLIPRFPKVEIGAHFHSNPTSRKEKLAAAYAHGCRRFDTALNGFGGCPFAKDELVGNIATESLIAFCTESQIPLSIKTSELAAAMALANEVFAYH